MLAMPRFVDGAIDMQELLRRLAEQVVNAVMGTETDQLCGGWANSRNDYRERGLATYVGTLMQRIPKLRFGSFFPDDVIERHRRVNRALVPPAPRYKSPARAVSADQKQPLSQTRLAECANALSATPLTYFSNCANGTTLQSGIRPGRSNIWSAT